jgi:putative flippase GtrA
MPIDKWFVLKVIKFGCVGCVVYIYDTLAFTLLLNVLDSSVVARLISVASAILLSWIINHKFTYRYAWSDLRVQKFATFFISQLPGAAINAIATLVTLHGIEFVGERPWLAVAIGSLAGMISNFTMAHHFVFSRKE